MRQTLCTGRARLREVHERAEPTSGGKSQEGSWKEVVLTGRGMWEPSGEPRINKAESVAASFASATSKTFPARSSVLTWDTCQCYHVSGGHSHPQEFGEIVERPAP